jgi:predicted MPP superfamily phosphohydrolase
MQPPARPIKSPEQPAVTPAIAIPSDVHFSVAWRVFVLLAGAIASLLLWKRQWPSIATAGFTAGVLWHYGRHHEPAHPRLVQRTIADSRFPAALNGFTIAQISDIHLGQPHSDSNLAWTIKTLRGIKPDLICLTGDLVNNRSALTRLSRYVRQLHAPSGIVAIAGNHDYAEGIDDVRSALSFAGVPLLRNQGMTIQHNHCTVWLAGVDDVWHGRMDIQEALCEAPAGMPIILLAHAPDAVREASRYPNIVLQLSGHVHGGHVRVPGLGPLAKPRFGRHYTHGTFRVGTVHLHVSVGLSGRAFRLGTRPEVTVIRCMHLKEGHSV